MFLSIDAVCHAIETSSVGTAIEGSPVGWPIIESFHLFAMVLMVGTITAFDVRLMGLAMRHVPVSRLARRILPWTWGAFGMMVLTGGLLFASEAETKYCFNPAFQIKLALILLAGVNMSIFHFTVYRGVAKWDQSATTPLGLKVIGTLSVVLWAGVIIAGRWIGFAAIE
jgi:hypothetical protein